MTLGRGSLPLVLSSEPENVSSSQVYASEEWSDDPLTEPIVQVGALESLGLGIIWYYIIIFLLFM